MKSTPLTLCASAFSLLASAALAADEVKLQLKWVTQAQFAGYYVALDRGLYGEEDLDVTILPGGPDIAPTQVLAGGGADGRSYGALLAQPGGWCDQCQLGLFSVRPAGGRVGLAAKSDCLYSAARAKTGTDICFGVAAHTDGYCSQ